MSRNFFDYYTVDKNEKILGEGGFGIVKRCRDRWTGSEFAVKIISSKSDEDLQDIRKEVSILRKLRHRHIIVLHDSFEERNVVYLVLDLVIGGELYEDITVRKTYTEADASDAMHQILEAISYCHQAGVVHSDLKPQNILLESKERGAPIKIADFGLAFEVKGDERARRHGCGTLTHLPPEVLNNQPYGKPIDIWACGVILYTLLVGQLPFDHNNDNQLTKLIINAHYDYPRQIDNTITPLAKQLIQHMLCADSYKRFTAAQAFKHPWIADRKRLVPKQHLQETVVNLKKFNARRKFKGGILAAIAANRFIKESPSEPFGGMKARVSSGSINTVKRVNNTMDQERREEEIIKISIKLMKACNIGDYKTIRKLCDPDVRDILVDLKDKMENRELSFANTACGSCVKVDTAMLYPHVYLLGYSAACITYILLNKYYCQLGHDHPHQEEVTKVWHKLFGKWKLVHIHCSDTDPEF